MDDTGGVGYNKCKMMLFLSAINETASSDGAVHVEIVAQGIQYDTDSKTHIRRNTRRRVYLRRERKWKKGLQDYEVSLCKQT